MPCRLARLAAMLAALVVGWAALPPPDAQPVPGVPSPTGTVRLASGETIHYAYHYDRNALAKALDADDRNALAGARIAGDAIVALTDSGTLLRFDRTTLKFTKERLGPPAATALGRGADGAILAGLDDGRIVRVDPASLEFVEIARVKGKVQWVGSIAAEPGPGRPSRPRPIAVVESEGGSRSIVLDPEAGKSYTIGPEVGRKLATAFHLDRKHRLWLGADNGEWGGWCSFVDLDAGKVQGIPGLKIYDEDISPGPAWLGVYGFAELRDGQVWAHGGTMHMGHTEGFIWRVDRGKAEELYRLDNFPPNLEALRKKQRAEAARRAKEAKEGRKPAAEPEEPEPDPKPDPLPTDRPYLPITHVVEDPATGSVLVLAFSDLYRTDAKFARWEQVRELSIRYQGGRRDAMGTYPSVRSVLPIEEPGRPMGLILATRFDGLVRLAAGPQADHAIPGQLSIGSVDRIARSSEGLLFLGDPTEGETWRYRDGSWNPVSFAPPFEAISPDERMDDPPPDEWNQSTTLVGRDGSIVTVNATGWTPGTRTTARWRDGKAEILGREVSSLIPSASFLTPDGQLWNADNSILRRFVNGRWVDVEAAADPRGIRRADWNGYTLVMETIGEAGPPWILHDRRNQMLLRLTHGPDFQAPRLTIVPINEAGQERRLKVRDAIPWSKGELLLATDHGLRTFAIADGRLAVPALNIGGRLIPLLARDGLGRTWLGNEGLSILDADGRTFHALDEWPILGRAAIDALAPDPAHPDGVVAAVHDRGVLFLRVEAPR